MKKISLMLMGLLLGGMSTFCNAQSKITVWYGANISSLSVDGGSVDSEFKPLNIGVDKNTLY